MPNRIIKDSIRTSPTIDGLSMAEEVFFYRLMVSCDDFGRFDGRFPILRAACFPLRLDTISDGDISDWLWRLAESGLVSVYSVKGQPYIQLTTWEKHQQIRAQRSKFPSPDCADPTPDISCNQPISTDSACTRNPNPIRIQSESESCSKSKEVALASATMIETAGPKFSEGDEPYDLSLLLRARILCNDPKAKVPNATPKAMARWSQDFDLLSRVDQRTPSEIRDLIEWSQTHDFWRTVALSPGSVRKNFTKMALQMNAPARASPNARKPEPVRDPAFYAADPYMTKIRENQRLEAAEARARGPNA